ncbi:MAG: hypothetical protein KIS92_01150 [Planctomycetota bacterium]|nr:hypothetical protein [Planctomycetota bacterium]
MGIVALGLAAFLLAVGVGFAFAPAAGSPAQTSSAPQVTVVPDRPEKATPLPAPVPRESTPAPAKPKPIETPRPEPQPKPPADPRTAAGEVLGGLQIVVHVDRVEVEPGANLNVAWEIVNHLDTPVQYLDVKPAIAISKDGWRGTYVAAGRNRPATPDDVKQIGANGTMSYERSIEWPRRVPNQPDDWPDYSRPGTYKLTVGFQGDPSIPAAADQLQKEKGAAVYRHPLVSGTVTIVVKGEAPQPPPSKTADPVNEEF